MAVSPVAVPVANGTVPGQGHLGPTVDRFDARADALLERLRGHHLSDLIFTTASTLGDFSAIWHAIGIGRGIVLRRPDQAVALAMLLGVESVIVNQGIKRLFRRERPTIAGDDRSPVRIPSTSAFPSGHASSAAFAAMILSAWDGRRLGVVWWSVAAVVGASRAYVRIHHASDVVGGAVVGTVLGLGARAALRRLEQGRAGPTLRRGRRPAR